MTISSDTPSSSYPGGDLQSNQSNGSPVQGNLPPPVPSSQDSVLPASFSTSQNSSSISNNPQSPLLSKYIKTIITSSQELQRLFNQMDVDNILSEKALKQYLNEMAVLLRDSLPPSRYPIYTPGSTLQTTPQPPTTIQQPSTASTTQPPPLTPPSNTPPPLDPYYQQRIGSDKQLESLQELRDQALSAGKGENLFKLINLKFNRFIDDDFSDINSKKTDSKQEKKEKQLDKISKEEEKMATIEAANSKKDANSKINEELTEKKTIKDTKKREIQPEKRSETGFIQPNQNQTATDKTRKMSQKADVSAFKPTQQPSENVKKGMPADQSGEALAFTIQNSSLDHREQAVESTSVEHKDGYEQGPNAETSNKMNTEQQSPFSFDDPAIQHLLGLKDSQPAFHNWGPQPIPSELHEKAIMAGHMQTLVLISLAGFSASKEAVQYSFSPSVINTPEGQHQVRVAVSVGFAKQLISQLLVSSEANQRRGNQREEVDSEGGLKKGVEPTPLRSSIESLIENDPALKGLEEGQKRQLADEIESNTRESFIKIALSSLQGSLQMPELSKLVIDNVQDALKDSFRSDTSKGAEVRGEIDDDFFAKTTNKEPLRETRDVAIKQDNSFVTQTDIRPKWTPVVDDRSQRRAEKVVDKALNQIPPLPSLEKEQVTSKQTPLVIDRIVEERQIKEPVGFFEAVVEELSSRGVDKGQSERSAANLLFIGFLGNEKRQDENRTNKDASEDKSLTEDKNSLTADPYLRKTVQHLLLAVAKDLVTTQKSGLAVAPLNIDFAIQKEIQKVNLPKDKALELTKELFSFFTPSEASFSKEIRGDDKTTQPPQQKPLLSTNLKPQPSEPQRQLISSLEEKIDALFGASMAPRQLEKLQKELVALLLPTDSVQQPLAATTTQQEINRNESKQIHSMPDLLIRAIQHNKVLQRDQAVIQKQEEQLIENFREFMSQHIDLAKWAEQVTDPATALVMAYSLTNKGIFTQSGSDSKISIGA